MNDVQYINKNESNINYENIYLFLNHMQYLNEYESKIDFFLPDLKMNLFSPDLKKKKNIKIIIRHKNTQYVFSLPNMIIDMKYMNRYTDAAENEKTENEKTFFGKKNDLIILQQNNSIILDYDEYEYYNKNKAENIDKYNQSQIYTNFENMFINFFAAKNELQKNYIDNKQQNSQSNDTYFNIIFMI